MLQKEIKRKKIVIFSFTEQGSSQNRCVRRHLEEKGYACESYAVKRYAEKFGVQPMPDKLQEWIGARWGGFSFLFIGAIGIAVRMIAPWVKDKYSDSAVIVMDELANYVIPVLSGHVGSGVRLAEMIAECIDAIPVITTATDVEGKFAVDVFAADNRLKLTDRELAKRISAAVLDGMKIGIYSEFPLVEIYQPGGDGKNQSLTKKSIIPKELAFCDSPEELAQYPFGIVITESKQAVKEQMKINKNILYLTARPYVIGVGCRKGVSFEKLSIALEQVCRENKIDMSAVSAFTSIDLKREEEAILCLAKKYGVPFQTFSAEELNTIETVSSCSEFVASVTGVDNVCERAARRYCPKGELVLPKQKLGQVTAAIVKKPIQIHFTGTE